MVQSIEERLRHCNVLTKNWCLICTTRDDKERGGESSLLIVKVSDYLGDAINKKSVYTSESRLFNAAHVNML